MSGALEVSPEEFFQMRNSSAGDFTGVYVICNETKDMCYVGQAKNVFQRVNHHFTGHGNGDVYADYKYGDSFAIKMIALVNSGFSSLDELERYMIKAYCAYSKGYNKTRGNGG